MLVLLVCLCPLSCHSYTWEMQKQFSIFMTHLLDLNFGLVLPFTFFSLTNFVPLLLGTNTGSCS